MPETTEDYRLIILRHAKSSWKTEGMLDHDRPLNGRGKRDAPQVAERLVDLGWTPDFVTSSDSARTRETWEQMRPYFPAVDILFTRRLYHADLDDIREVATELVSNPKTWMVIGHNPGWEEAVFELARVSEPMTTCNAALLTVTAKNWNEALMKHWNLLSVVRPKELDSPD